MKGQKILIVWEHGGNLGHLSRLLPIALALQRLGCEVVFAVADVLAARRYFGALCFSFVALPRIKFEFSHESGALNHADVLLKAGFGEPTRARLCIEQWHALFESLKPGAVLVDSSPLALYAAQSAGLAVLVIGHGFEIPPSRKERPCFTPWIENAAEKSSELENRLQRAFEDLSQGLAPAWRVNAPASLDELFQLERVALCAWPEFDHFDRLADSPHHLGGYAGPIWAEPPDATHQNWPDGDGPKVLCYLNLRDKRYDLIWQALRQLGTNVMVISPNGSVKACEAARGWAVQVNEKSVLVSHLMPDCDAVVGHGGMGLTSMALHSGKPTLLLPEHMEQAILAYRLSKQGLATATIRLKDKTLLRKKMDELFTNSSLKLRAKSFADKYLSYQTEHAVNSVVSRLKALVER